MTDLELAKENLETALKAASDKELTPERAGTVVDALNSVAGVIAAVAEQQSANDVLVESLAAFDPEKPKAERKSAPAKRKAAASKRAVKTEPKSGSEKPAQASEEKTAPAVREVKAREEK